MLGHKRPHYFSGQLAPSKQSSNIRCNRVWGKNIYSRHFCYQLYGLTLESCAPIPFLPPCEPHENSSERIILRLTYEPHAERFAPLLRGYEVEAGTNPLRLNILEDGYEFVCATQDTTAVYVVNAAASEMVIHLKSERWLKDALAFVAHPLMRYIAWLRRRICLHANIISNGEEAIAILGASGAGKSTLSAGLINKGYRIHADDVAALSINDSRILVHGGIPHLKIHAATAKLLGGGQQNFTPVFEDLADKGAGKVFLLNGDEGAPTIKLPPLRAIYALGPRVNPNAAISKFHLRSQDALQVLLSHCQGSEILDKPGQAWKFLQLARVASVIPVKSLNLPDSLPRIEEACDVLLTDCAWA